VQKTPASRRFPLLTKGPCVNRQRIHGRNWARFAKSASFRRMASFCESGFVLPLNHYAVGLSTVPQSIRRYRSTDGREQKQTPAKCIFRLIDLVTKSGT
jgi:hypothetical protein